MRLLHIVPRVPPEIDGIGDFAARLGGRLDAGFGVQSAFLGCDPDQRQGATPILPLQSAEALVREVRSQRCDAILLHYVGYGYDRRGLPGWLVSGMEALHAVKIPVITFFHEIWTETQPWRSAFYFAAAQRRLVRRLQAIASGTATSTPGMQRRLGAGAVLAPIPSAIDPVPRIWKESDPMRVVVFGQEHTRARTLRAHERLVERLAPGTELRLVGKGAAPDAADAALARRFVPRARVACIGDAAAPDVAREFAAASLALSFYPLDFLTKSSSVMAALACGCPVALPRQDAREEYRPRPPVLMPDERSLQADLAGENLWRVSEMSQGWYRQHADWPVLLGRLAPLLKLPALSEAAT